MSKKPAIVVPGPKEIEELITYLKSTGTGEAKLLAIRQLGKECDNSREFLLRAATVVPPGTYDKIVKYVDSVKEGSSPPIPTQDVTTFKQPSFIDLLILLLVEEYNYKREEAEQLVKEYSSIVVNGMMANNIRATAMAIDEANVPSNSIGSTVGPSSVEQPIPGLASTEGSSGPPSVSSEGSKEEGDKKKAAKK